MREGEQERLQFAASYIPTEVGLSYQSMPAVEHNTMVQVVMRKPQVLVDTIPLPSRMVMI